MPPRKDRDAIVGAVVAELLYRWKASILYQKLVQEKKLAVSVDGGVNWPLGNQFEYNGPTLLAAFIVYPNEVKESDLLNAYNSAVSSLATDGPSTSELDTAITNLRSDWDRQLEIPVDRAEVMSLATLFDGTPAMVNDIPNELESVSAANVKEFVTKYLAKTNRTIINRVPATKAETSSGNEKKNR